MGVKAQGGVGGGEGTGCGICFSQHCTGAPCSKRGSHGVGDCFAIVLFNIVLGPRWANGACVCTRMLLRCVCELENLL